MFLVIIVLLIIISIIVGRKNAIGIKVDFYFNKFTHWRYSLGLSFREYTAENPETKEQHILEVLNIGLFFMDIELEFYKK